MKKLWFAVAVAALFCSCDSDKENKRRELILGHSNSIRHSEVIDTVGLRVRDFKLNDHDYQMFMDCSGAIDGVIHNPDCKKCINK